MLGGILGLLAKFTRMMLTTYALMRGAHGAQEGGLPGKRYKGTMIPEESRALERSMLYCMNS